MANQFFKLDGLVEMVTRRVSEDFNGFLANASGYQNTQFQKLICPDCYVTQWRGLSVLGCAVVLLTAAAYQRKSSPE